MALTLPREIVSENAETITMLLISKSFSSDILQLCMRKQARSLQPDDYNITFSQPCQNGDREKGDQKQHQESTHESEQNEQNVDASAENDGKHHFNVQI